MSLLTIKIYLGNLIHNYQTLKIKTPNLGAVVKADAYGLGALVITKALRKQGCKTFFVATASEGKILRQKFSDVDIYVFDGFIEQKTIVDYALKPVLNTVQQLQEWSQSANNNGAILHIDTGMNRLGIPFRDIHTITIQNVKIDYVMTHFSDSESNFSITQKQTDMIMHSAEYLKIPNISIANSGGILWHTPVKDSYLGRAGIGLYGGIESNNLRSVVSVSGKILQKKQIPAYEPVGYGSTFITQRPTTLLTVAGGYADGIMRSLSNSTFCGYINGYTIPLVGRVSMDTTIFDASDLPDTVIQEATELEFFGLNNLITKISECAKTIPYEFLTNLSRRANRVIIA
jgi:alanine racemase